jgi:uridine kinase
VRAACGNTRYYRSCCEFDDALSARRSVTVPTILPVYPKVVEALTPIMRGLPGVIVTIDGRDGVGKTTLGRYLAWHFNVTLIETDLFLIPAQDYLIHLDDQINRIIERRVTSPRPVIVEGISMLQLMKRLNRVPDFSIYCTSPQQSRSKLLERRLSAYEAAFAPFATANLVVEIDH